MKKILRRNRLKSLRMSHWSFLTTNRLRNQKNYHRLNHWNFQSYYHPKNYRWTSQKRSWKNYNNYCNMSHKIYFADCRHEYLSKDKYLINRY
jgi:hypothetical protein